MMREPPPNPVGSAIARCGLARAMVVAFVCLTAALSLAWSHAKLLSQDEMYAFQTDSVSSVARLVHVQRTWPISLDPLLDHLLSHLAMQVFGVGAFALRLPAFLGFLLMQVCLFFFVRNLAGERAGLVAAAFPALTATLYYSAEGRPYGLMLGLYALALWSWQEAARRSASRGWAITGLAAAIALTLNAHYFGILLLVPICAAEGFRTVTRRKLDGPVIAAICAGALGFLATIPFLKAAGEFKKNYYNGDAVSRHDITRAYRSIFIDYTRLSMGVQHTAAALLVIFAAALLWGCLRVALRGRREAGLRETGMQIPTAEWVLILTLAALPFCGYLLARFVTHSIEVRYVLGALVAISAMVAISIAPWLKRDALFHAALVVLGLGILTTGGLRIRSERQTAAGTLASYVLPPEIQHALDANPDRRLYIQHMGLFESASYYEPDADLRARITLVYSSAEELRWDRHDTMALTAEHLRHFTALPIVSYEELKTMPGEHIFVLVHSGWDWTDQAFAQDGASVRPIGHAMGWDAAAVSFR
jgi:hypothetical protein